jgi:hypothetical protein
VLKGGVLINGGDAGVTDMHTKIVPEGSDRPGWETDSAG